MKISYNWLKEYLDFDENPEETAGILTNTGLEVGSVEKFESIKGGLLGLVVGEVIKKEKHPNADKLSVTEVNVGDVTLPIVCGAPNVAVGQKVIVATPGTILYPKDGEPFKIKKSKIRGEVSEGMICAEDEIGVGESHDGIMVLSPEVKIGTAANSYFEIQDDHVLEVDLTPNRIDGVSHIGTARDIAAVLGLKNKVEVKWPDISDFSVASDKPRIKITVENTELCPRYSGIEISDIIVAESPTWLKNRLKSVGLNPINNVVDITNFVLRELGQPLHAFDADKIAGNEVIIKKGVSKTKFKTLDDIERELSGIELMICNKNEGMCIAGVFGGIDSGVSSTTKNIFLESAYFNPVSVRKTAKHHGLNTDASFHFERGVDPNITITALKRAAILIRDICGGEITSEVQDIYPKAFENFLVDFNTRNCTKVIGQKIEDSDIRAIFCGLDIKILSEDADDWKLSVPPYRVDVQREIDVIEEVLRIYGYNNIKLPETMKLNIQHSDGVDKEELINNISTQLTSIGFTEIMNNSLTNSEHRVTNESSVKILNPLSKELEEMRTDLIDSALSTISHNIKHKLSDIKIFEFGNSYFKIEKEYVENSLLQISVTGKRNEEHWELEEKETSIYDVLGVAEQIASKIGISWTKLKSEPYDDELSLGLRYSYADLKSVFRIAQVKSGYLNKFEIKQNVYFLEFNWGMILKLVKRNKIKYQPISSYPVVKRDFALLIRKEIQYADLCMNIRKTEKKLLKGLNIFDVFEGKNIPKGMKSYAIRVHLQDVDKTLDESRIEKCVGRIMDSLKREFDASLR